MTLRYLTAWPLCAAHKETKILCVENTLLFFGCNTVMSLVETRSRDENILWYCHPKKCIPWCIDRAVNTPFVWRCIRFQSIRRRRHCRFNIGFDMEGEQLNVSNQWISRKIIWLLQLKLMRMDILYIYILQIIIKCHWTLNEAIHEILWNI